MSWKPTGGVNKRSQADACGSVKHSAVFGVDSASRSVEQPLCSTATFPPLLCSKQAATFDNFFCCLSDDLRFLT